MNFVAVLNRYTCEWKDWKAENDLHLELLVEQPASMPNPEFVAMGLALAKCCLRTSFMPYNPYRDSVDVCFIEDPSPELLAMLKGMQEHFGDRHDSPIGRSVLLPALEPYVLSEGYWRGPAGELMYGWYPGRLEAAEIGSDENIIKRDWEGPWALPSLSYST
jgi:hypothetical protein